MDFVTLPVASLVLLVVWLTGAFFFPLGGMIHFLLVVVLIVLIIDRVGRHG